MSMSNFYQHNKSQPFHISVGAVLFNENYEICTHHFFTERLPDNLKFHAGGLNEYYHLVRESLENNETLESAVLRGVHEEFGVVGEVDKYIGAKEDVITGHGYDFQKITLYHSVKLVRFEERPDIDAENHTLMEWYTPKELLKIYDKQVSQTDRPELDERIIVERFMDAYGLK